MSLTRRWLLALLGAAPLLPRALAQEAPTAPLPELPAPEVLPLYKGAAPGTEHWTHSEVREVEDRNTLIRNVSQPSLLSYRPARPNGTAVIVCPGGAFYFLSLGNEGFDLARKLLAQGFTVFILKYRLIPSHQNWHTELDLRLKKPGWEKSLTDEIGDFTLADAQAAVRTVRARAAEFKINPARIGTLGFSAGGYVATRVAAEHSPASRPDFAATIYGMRPPDPAPSADLPPLFMAWANDDDLVTVEKHALPLQQLWKQAGAPVELHLFEHGGHGFGSWSFQQPSDHWLELFVTWVNSHASFATAPKPAAK